MGDLFTQFHSNIIAHLDMQKRIIFLFNFAQFYTYCPYYFEYNPLHLDFRITHISHPVIWYFSPKTRPISDSYNFPLFVTIEFVVCFLNSFYFSLQTLHPRRVEFYNCCLCTVRWVIPSWLPIIKRSCVQQHFSHIFVFSLLFRISP